MGALAFFPWFSLDSDVTVGGYRLSRYIRGNQPGREQETIDEILQAYLEGETRAIRQATLLHKEGSELLADLADEEMADLFEVAEVVSFAGLASREYFAPARYSNRETFNLVVQRFQGRGQGVGVISRRRDGSTRAYVSPSQNRVRRPISQNGVSAVALDGGLLTALLEARDHDDWEHLSEAVYFFGRANTDSDVVSEESECVEMVGAFERLLQCFHGKEHELAEAFMALWQPTEWLDPAGCDRIPAAQRDRRVAESWLRDFFGHRGFHAHGRRAVSRPTIWSRSEHLLLGAYAFPLLVRLWLAKRGLYTLTDRDQDDIDIFEQLVCARLFREGDDESTSYPWNEIRSLGAIRRVVRRSWRKLLGETGTKTKPDERA